MILHPRVLIAAAMVIWLRPKASGQIPAAWPRAGTYRERPGGPAGEICGAFTVRVSRITIKFWVEPQSAVTLQDRTSGGRNQYEKKLYSKLRSFCWHPPIPKNRCSQPSYCTVGTRGAQAYYNKNPTPVQRRILSVP